MAITHLSASDLQMIARNGASLVVRAGQFPATDLAAIARNLVGSATLEIEGSSALSAVDMAMVARNANRPASVCFN